MKRLIAAIILITMLALQINVFAIGAESLNDDNQSVVTMASISGNLEVDINLDMPIKNTTKEETEIKVLLRGKSSQVSIELGGDKAIEKEEVIIDGHTINYTVKKLNSNRGLTTLTDTEVYYYNIVFSNLPQGNYDIEVTGNGFSNVIEKNVKIEDYSQRVILNNHGSMLFGDFDRNNKIDEEDYKDLFDNIETKDKELIKKYDLNRDGIVDILDLHYVHENLSLVKENSEIINTDVIINPSNVVLETKEGQEVMGTSADLFKEEGTIQISAKDKNDNNIDITPENPVELTMDLGKATLMEIGRAHV